MANLNTLLYGNKISSGGVLHGAAVYSRNGRTDSQSGGGWSDQMRTPMRNRDEYYQNDNNDYHTRDSTTELERERVRLGEERMRRKATERALRTEQQLVNDTYREMERMRQELASARSLIRDQQEKWWINEPAIYIPWRYDQWLEALEGGS